ncbi:MAG: hypothetical protein ISP74_02595 [Bacteroidia bacterium]|nr:hypothetical protein [Bacteroidia bacterium]
MKTILIIFIALLSNFCYSQVDVNLILNHQYNGEQFMYSQNYQDENGNVINISRLQYYISSIELTDNSELNIPLSDVYVLANGNVSNYSLGSFDVSSVSKLEFDLGVDYTTNHGNSNNYPSDHPLGPQSPLMDWGWPAGYFFLVIDGTIDDNGDGIPNKQFQLRSLGDIMLQNVDYLNGAYESLNNSINLALNVNIEKWLSGIDLINVGIDHSSSGNNLSMCNNTINNQVFQTINPASTDYFNNVIDITTDYNISYAPTINYKLNNNLDFNLKIFNSIGQLVLKTDNVGFEGNYFIRKELKNGNYFAVFYNDQFNYKHKFTVIR